MSILFLIIYAIWFLSEFLLSRLKRSGETDIKGADKNSLAIIWIVVVPSIIASSVIASSLYLPIAKNDWIRYAGLAAMTSGIILRLVIIQSLGRFFTVDVTIRSDHQLKKDGFYSLVRHPSYTAALITFIGFGISLNNWVSLAIISISAFMAFLYRIRVEEEALMKQFGGEYVQYKKTTKAIIPFLF